MQSRKQILVFVRTDIAPEMEEDFNRWYEEEHIPRLLKVPGVLWAKRGIKVVGRCGVKCLSILEGEDHE